MYLFRKKGHFCLKGGRSHPTTPPHGTRLDLHSLVTIVLSQFEIVKII